jgi:hypothetical protein
VSEQDHSDGVRLLREIADSLESEREVIDFMARACLIALEAGVLPENLKRDIHRILVDGGWIGDGAGREPVDAVLRHDLGGEG